MARRRATDRTKGGTRRRTGRAAAKPRRRVPSDHPVLKREEWLRLAKQGSPMGLWYWNEETGRVFCDAAACAMFGVPPGGTRPADIFFARMHPEDMDRVRTIWRYQLEQALPYDLEYRTVWPDGTVRCLHALGNGYYDGDGKPVRMVGVLFDVTEQRKADRERLELSGRLINAQEEERRHLARELHDDFSQRLAILAIDLTRVADEVKSAAPDAHARIRSLIESMNTISDELHSLSHRLHTAKLDLLGLASSSQALCSEFSKQHAIAVEFVPADVPSSIQPDAALCLFRVLQEALRNVGKHSGASRVDVTLKGGADDISLIVADNGVGFDARGITSSGIGIQSMRERVRMLSGTIEVHSRPTYGTTVSVAVPCRS
jgi:PAS domain S-box-containing protein